MKMTCDRALEQFHKCLFINTGKYDSTKLLIDKKCMSDMKNVLELCGRKYHTKPNNNIVKEWIIVGIGVTAGMGVAISLI